MDEFRFVIPGRLPGLNEIVAASKDHFGSYAKMKRSLTKTVAAQAVATAGRTGKPRFRRVAVFVRWVEPNRRRDKDNIEAGIKFILDGLVEAGIIPNDGWRHVADIHHSFAVDRDNPRVEVILKAQEEDVA